MPRRCSSSKKTENSLPLDILGINALSSETTGLVTALGDNAKD